MEASIKAFEWSKIGYDRLVEPREQAHFLAGFQAYLNRVWESRNWYREEAVEQEGGGESRVEEQGFFTFAYNSLKARNYVGVVQYKGRRLEVYPKLFRDDEQHDYSLYFQHILYWLSYCRKLNFPVSKASLSQLPTDDFLEALIFLFAHQTEALLSEQPFQAFEEVQEETSFLRGRLAVPEYIRQNVSTGRWQYFQSEYEPLVYDNQFNRIVKYTTKFLLELTANEQNKRKLLDIQFLLDEVSDIACIASDCDKVKLNPLYSELADVLHFCRMFLDNLTISNEAPEEHSFCFLLPMECVFEDFIYSFLMAHFPHLRAKEQLGGYLTHNGERAVFRIKNDILIEKLQLIIDTKYKLRQDVKDGKAGVSQNDLYQMLAYAVKRGYRDVLLLYPEAASITSPSATFTISSPFLPDQPIHVKANNICIHHHEIQQLEEEIKEQLSIILMSDKTDVLSTSIL